MFTKKQLRALLVPLIIEQVLTALMGMADTFMVSAVGEAAISGVALVDSLNQLVINFFSALAAGGTIVCSQYIGSENPLQANHASNQVMSSSLVMATMLCAILAPLRRPLLRLIFGTVELAVLDAADVYLLVTALSYPFLALYTGSAALFRATGDAKRPMIVAALADLMNVIGNAVLIFIFDMGVLGAALATLASRIFSAAVMLYFQARPDQVITLGRGRAFLPDWSMLRRILRVGIPSGIENGMFQFGKLVVQSTVSTLGTTAIAAQAIIAALDSASGMPGQAIGIGLLTVAGQCMGRGRPDEARKYILRFVLMATIVNGAGGLLIAILVPAVTQLTGLSPDGARLTMHLTWFICVMRLGLWPLAFTLPNGLRAAGDVAFPMWVTILSMWIIRVGLCWVLCRCTGVGLWGVWIAWCTDWLVRAICFTVRFRQGKWQTKKVLD